MNKKLKFGKQKAEGRKQKAEGRKQKLGKQKAEMPGQSLRFLFQLSALELTEEEFMPERQTIERARQDAREGKPPTTQAGEFVREEMHHASEGKHPVKSRKQAIAIGLSKARQAGVKIPDRSGRAGGKRHA